MTLAETRPGFADIWIGAARPRTLPAAVAPVLVHLGWPVVVVALLLGPLSGMFNLPQWVDDLSPFTHVPLVPVEPMRWLPVVVMRPSGKIMQVLPPRSNSTIVLAASGLAGSMGCASTSASRGRTHQRRAMCVLMAKVMRAGT